MATAWRVMGFNTLVSYTQWQSQCDTFYLLKQELIKNSIYS